MSGRQEILLERLMLKFEDLKTHIAEVERSQQLLQTKSVPPVILLGQSLRK